MKASLAIFDAIRTANHGAITNRQCRELAEIRHERAEPRTESCPHINACFSVGMEGRTGQIMGSEKRDGQPFGSPRNEDFGVKPRVDAEVEAASIASGGSQDGIHRRWRPNDHDDACCAN